MPGIFTEDDLNEFRALTEELAMPNTATILRGTLVPTRLAGARETQGTVTTGGTALVPCSYRPTSANEMAIAGAMQVSARWIVKVPALWDIQAGDEVYITDEGKVLRVTGILAPKSNEIVRQAFATEP